MSLVVDEKASAANAKVGEITCSFLREVRWARPLRPI